jgi:long-chain acyl-CoA synthetase
VRGPTVMLGYLDAPELTRETIVDGWLRTGDLGTIDAAGHLKLLGRTKNMIVTEGGKNVYPEDIEAAFDAVACEELCVFAERYLFPARELAGERLCLVIRPKQQIPLEQTLAALRAANRALAAHKRVGSYLIASEEFPKTASLKIKREQLANALRAAPARPEPLSS